MQMGDRAITFIIQAIKLAGVFDVS